ncbi:MAG: tRNA lysidine(34) synthetase TilS [Alphaproteobacteria bacterium]
MTIDEMTSGPILPAECEKLFACLEGASHVGLAVSGGADSLALMHLVHGWRQHRGARTPRLSVLTIDHGLRPESAGEAEWVAKQAEALGLPGVILRWRSDKKTSAIQENAREARYALMAEFAHANALDALVSAHHLDDQAETVLMRLGRGSGVDGLAAMPALRSCAGVPLHRPLLDVPKARLVATLQKLGCEWLEDPSNEDTRFERVRVRRAMEKLADIGISAQALARTARRLRRAREALDQIAARFLSDHAKLEDAGYCRIAMAALHAAPDDIVLRALARAIEGVGGSPSRLRMSKLEALLEALREGAKSAVTLGGCRIVPGEDELLVLREAGRTGLDDIVLKPGECGLWDNRYRVSLGKASSDTLHVRALGSSGYGQIRARLGLALTLPEHAADGIVSFWNEDSVLAVPPLGYCAPEGELAGCEANFVNSALFSG